MGPVVSFLNTNSPFAPAAQVTVSNPLGAGVFQGAAGVSTSSGTIVANASLSSLGGSSSAFGSLISGTMLVFGNFFAALQYIAKLAVGALLPYQYVYNWLAWSSDPSVTATATAIAGMVNVLVWVAYANDFFYILSGRWLLS